MMCPMCGADTTKDYRPFCSRRCADRDLANWFAGTYATPSDDDEDIEAVEIAAIQPLKPQ